MDISFSRLIGRIPPQIRRALTLRFDRSQFDSVDKLAEFVQTRAAYVAQTSLYGYLKTRMGTQFRVMFEDDVYSKSIDFAKWRIYASCLADLAIFSAATVGDNSELDDETSSKLAEFCFQHAVEQDLKEAGDPELVAKIVTEFSDRLKRTNWPVAGSGENAFTASPPDLIKWAPIVDEFKELDEEIVLNSIRFRWVDIREQLRKRINAEAIRDDWINSSR